MSRDRWLTVAVAVVAALLASFGVGQLVGESLESGESHRSDPAAGPGPAAEAGSPAPSAPPVLAAVPVPPRTYTRGLPPMARVGAGPYGTLTVVRGASVALTFDDGPDPRWTPAVLRALRAHRVPATFCVVGSQVEAHPELVRAIVADGHTLCNHSWEHDVGLGDRPPEAIRADLVRTSAAIRAAAPGARVSYYRQPGGAWTEDVVRVAHSLGMWPLHWAVDPQDWRRPGPAEIVAHVLAEAAPGAVVLLHDGGGDRSGTVRALHRLLPALADRLGFAALPPGGP